MKSGHLFSRYDCAMTEKTNFDATITESPSFHKVSIMGVGGARTTTMHPSCRARFDMQEQTKTNNQKNRLGRNLPKKANAPLYLASRSPRRRKLLNEVGIDVHIIETGVDDGLLDPGDVSIEQWTLALAYFKAKAGAIRLEADGKAGVVLGADTLIEHRGEIIGQPRNRSHAREILNRLENEVHHVITGVAIVDLETGRRSFLCDTARVDVGEFDDENINEYLDTDQWKGKAGAYNLDDRIDAGWPIQYEGDPGTIMGLPVKRLIPHLADRWGFRPDEEIRKRPTS